MSLSDKEWQARHDAETLARAEEIKVDPNKHREAKVAARKLLSEEEDRIAGIKKVAGKNVKIPTKEVTLIELPPPMHRPDNNKTPGTW